MLRSQTKYSTFWQNQVIKSGQIVGIGGREEEDNTQDVPEEGNIPADDIDESNRPGQEIESIKGKIYLFIDS